MEYLKEIRILNVDFSRKRVLNEELQMFSHCLGMFNKRDKEKSCFRIFVHLLEEKGYLSSEQLAKRSNLSRATVIHHIGRLIDSGLVMKKEQGYFLRFDSLEDLTREIEKDVCSTFKRLRKISKRIDEGLDI
ncbi:winged helix-turn-helix transcriptional regulator [Candidatus Pacearchaeota archaeon]|nr:winged helix-turn-helix transcriptional regulator [Candidatus Pacearchaeota archaeon]